MKVTQEKLPDSQLGLEIEISAQISQQSYEEVLKDLARNANIPGFRKGKVPRQILLQRLGSRYIKAATLENLLQKSIKEAIEQEKIESLGDYQLRSQFDQLVEQFTPGQPLVFLAAVDVAPSLELENYRSITVQAEEIVYEPQKVEDWLTEQQVKQATLVPLEDRSAEWGDLAIVDYQVYTNEEGKAGEAIAGVQGTDLNVDLETGRFVEGLVEGIIGLKPEETKEIPVVFPEDYPREDLAGQPVIFSITVKELKARELPERDDDFAQEVSEFETFAELQESLEKRFQEEAAEATKDNVREAILKELVNISQVDLPNTLIQEEINRVLTRMAMQFEQLGIDLRQIFTQDSLPGFRDNARGEAVENIKKALIIEEIASKESIVPDQEAIQAKFTRLKSELTERDIDFDRLKTVLQEEALLEATLDWLQEQITVEFVPEGSLSQEEEAEDETEAADQTVEITATEVVAEFAPSSETEKTGLESESIETGDDPTKVEQSS